MHARRPRQAPLHALALPFLAALLGCGSTRDAGDAPRAEPGSAPGDVPRILYVGSSTIANFMADAERPYGRARIVIDSVPESLGGERAIQDGNADLAGVAWDPMEETLAEGVQATLIGTDTIAVVVNEKNPVTGLSLAQLRGIFTGKIKNWKEVGGQDLQIRPMVVGRESATRAVFRILALGGDAYAAEAKVVTPDSSMPMEVEAEPGGIGTISFSFLCSGGVVRVLRVEGEQPLPGDLEYPIIRPLYLLWRPENEKAKSFMAWVESPAGQELLGKCFGKPRPLPKLVRPAPE
jgi:phosphate transport system substrate-binding protein